MTDVRPPDAVVVGAGPNGLAAAIALAERGLAVEVYEAGERVGGALQSAALTGPGTVHDLGSAIHPFAAASPAFRRWPLERYGVRWIRSPLVVAHPLDGGRAATLAADRAATAAALGRDGARWDRLVGDLLPAFPGIAEDVLRPLLRLPSNPLAMARFGLRALLPASLLARTFRTEEGRALVAGLAAHANVPLAAAATSAPALVLALLGHAVGWPFPAGGAQRLADALAAHLEALGGRIHLGRRINDLGDLPAARATLLDLTPTQLLRLAGPRLTDDQAAPYRRFRHAAAAFKVDYLLDGPVPWSAAACHRSATVHLGGTLEEIEASERAVGAGRPPERPFVLVAQPSRFDPSRAPAGRHTLWAYAHVPLRSTHDLRGAIEAQLERFAPGFGARVLERVVHGPVELEAWNPNLVGGDIAGGATTLRQMLARPIASPTPYATPLAGVYLCSSSTPPGPGVHGMSGWNAAQLALRREFGVHG